MGGQEAIMLSAKHPELFRAAGCMRGVMNIDTRMRKVSDDLRKLRQDSQSAMLGTDLNYDRPSFCPFTAASLVDKMKTNGLALIMD